MIQDGFTANPTRRTAAHGAPDVAQRLDLARGAGARLLDHQPAALRRFLDAARPNAEQLRLVTRALCAPVLGGPRAQDAAPTAELRALDRLNANWRSVVEGEAFARKGRAAVTGQLGLTLEGDDR